MSGHDLTLDRLVVNVNLKDGKMHAELLVTATDIEVYYAGYSRVPIKNMAE